MRRHALRDDRWERIEHLPPGREGHVGVTAEDDRPFVEAALRRRRAGIPWRACRSASVAGGRCAHGPADGPGPGSGRGSSPTSRARPTTGAR
jgi:hypothetical protein